MIFIFPCFCTSAARFGSTSERAGWRGSECYPLSIFFINSIFSNVSSLAFTASWPELWPRISASSRSTRCPRSRAVLNHVISVRSNRNRFNNDTDWNELGEPELDTINHAPLLKELFCVGAETVNGHYVHFKLLRSSFPQTFLWFFKPNSSNSL